MIKLYGKKFTCLRTRCELVVVVVMTVLLCINVCGDMKIAKHLFLMMETSNHKIWNLYMFL